jgi:hypothetical protein
MEATPETMVPARAPTRFDAGGDYPRRRQLVTDHVTAHADFLRDVGKRATFPAHLNNRRDLVFPQLYATHFLRRGQLAAMFRPTRVVGDTGPLRG